MCSPTPSFFVCSVIFVPQISLPVSYKYWPSPTFMFFSLIIISLLLVTSACLLILKFYSLYTQTEHRTLTFSYTSSGIPYSRTEDLSESIPYWNSQPSAKYKIVRPTSPTSRLCPRSHHLHPNMSPRLFG